MSVQPQDLVGIESVNRLESEGSYRRAGPAGPWWRELQRRMSARAEANAAAAAARTYRNLARRILADYPPTEEGRRIVVTSTGSITLCTEAMLMLAYFLRDEVNCHILMIDDAMPGDTIGERLGFSRARGLLDVFFESDHQSNELILPTSHPGISILPKGSTGVDGLSPFQLRRIPLMLEAVTRRFDYVLVQQSSILDDRRHRFFAAGADLSLLLVEEGATSPEEIELNRQAMTDAQARCVRLVLCTRA
jgi:hypothetical protein